MGWERVWTLALVQFGAEDIELRILVGLSAAFLVLMILEGLRASFRPARPIAHAQPEPPVSSRILAPKPVMKVAAKPALQPLRVRTVAVRTNPKRIKLPINRHRALRPMIRRGKSAGRTPTFTEEAVPYTPLSPTR